MGTESTIMGRDEFETMTCVVPVLDSKNGVMRARGTAFFVSDRGLLITARHVIDEKVPDDVPGATTTGRRVITTSLSSPQIRPVPGGRIA